MAFKIAKTPATNENDTGNPKTANIGPGRNSPVINEERADDTPDHPPEIKWPKADNGPKPFKSLK